MIKNQKKKQRSTWVVGGVIGLAALAILLVMFYSASLSLQSYRKGKTMSVPTRLTCSVDYSGRSATIKAQLVSGTIASPNDNPDSSTGIHGQTIPYSYETYPNNQVIIWSGTANSSKPQPSISRTNEKGIAITKIATVSDAGGVIHANFRGGFFRGALKQQPGLLKLTGVSTYYYEPSSCDATIEGLPLPKSTPSPSAIPGGESVVRKVGDREGSFLIQRINKNSVQGLWYQAYPVASDKGVARTLKVGDNIGYACEGKSEIVSSIDVVKQTVTFTLKFTTPPVGGCPI